eukprot:2024667-Rhodomonas_salina.1
MRSARPASGRVNAGSPGTSCAKVTKPAVSRRSGMSSPSAPKACSGFCATGALPSEAASSTSRNVDCRTPPHGTCEQKRRCQLEMLQEKTGGGDADIEVVPGVAPGRVGVDDGRRELENAVATVLVAVEVDRRGFVDGRHVRLLPPRREAALRGFAVLGEAGRIEWGGDHRVAHIRACLVDVVRVRHAVGAVLRRIHRHHLPHFIDPRSFC